MDDRFRQAVNLVLAHEGGYVNDPDDPGGETNFGITKRTYPGLDIKNLMRAQAEEIYHRDWWTKHGWDQIDHAELAATVFDLGVNMGAHRANQLLQAAVVDSGGGEIECDGILGPASLAAVNGHPHPEYLLAVFRLLAIQHYAILATRKPKRKKWLLGWVKRALGFTNEF
jgi:lysozyme family protein